MFVHDLPARLRTKFTVTDDCWEWTAGRFSLGYGAYELDGKTRLAHRVVYEALVGPIPEGRQLDHLCRVRHCVNPDHLEPVTPRENTVRGVGPSAQNSRKTHCPQGHPYSGENLYVDPRNRRRCRTCMRQNLRDWQARKRRAA